MDTHSFYSNPHHTSGDTFRIRSIILYSDHQSTGQIFLKILKKRSPCHRIPRSSSSEREIAFISSFFPKILQMIISPKVVLLPPTSKNDDKEIYDAEKGRFSYENWWSGSIMIHKNLRVRMPRSHIFPCLPDWISPPHHLMSLVMIHPLSPPPLPLMSFVSYEP